MHQLLMPYKLATTPGSQIGKRCTEDWASGSVKTYFTTFQKLPIVRTFTPTIFTFLSQADPSVFWVFKGLSTVFSGLKAV